MEMKNLRDWYVDLLKDSYSAETQIVEALPKMAQAVQSAQLRRAFEKHLEVTKQHIARLEQIFKDMGQKPDGKTCKGMEGLIKEGDELINKKKGQIDADVLDAALIAAAQKVEHYEIAGYGTAAAYAELLGEKSAAKVLHKIATEEGDADKKLTALAEGSINKEAKRQEASKSKGKAKKTTSKSSVKSRGTASKDGAKRSTKVGARA